MNTYVAVEQNYINVLVMLQLKIESSNLVT